MDKDLFKLRDGEVCIQVTSMSEDHFRAISEEKLKSISLDDILTIDEKREAVQKHSRKFYVSSTSDVDFVLVLDGTEDDVVWEDLGAYFSSF